MGKEKKKKRSKDRPEELDETGDRELLPTIGALGNEKLRKRSKRDEPGKKKVPLVEQPLQNPPTTRQLKPAFDDTPLVPRDNLAGIPGRLIRSPLGVKKNEMKSVGPWIQTNLNNESCIHFVVHSTMEEWIHFKSDAFSLVIFVEERNKNYDANAAADSPNRLQWHATRAKAGIPSIFYDPDIAGAGFFSRVEVLINNVPVPTSNCIGSLFSHYPRFMRIHYRQESEIDKRPHFTNSEQIVFDVPAGQVRSKIMTEALKPFDYGAATSTHGRRIPVPLDSAFPFTTKCLIHQALENVKAEDLYFPPDSRLEFKFYYHPTKMELLWTGEIGNNYWNLAREVTDHDQPLRMTIQKADLEYRSVKLHPTDHIRLTERYRSGEPGDFAYDIPRSQHQGLVGGATYTENQFRIWPYCRTLLIAFLPEHACFRQEHLKRPMSGFTTYPLGNTKTEIYYAGSKNLVAESYDRFGIRGEQNQLSKHQLYNYLRNNRLADFTFEELWPETGQSLVQDFVFDVGHLLSDQTQMLKINMHFNAGTNSPENSQIVVISIHPNGMGRVKNLSKDRCNWEWEFFQTN